MVETTCSWRISIAFGSCNEFVVSTSLLCRISRRGIASLQSHNFRSWVPNFNFPGSVKSKRDAEVLSDAACKFSRGLHHKTKNDSNQMGKRKYITLRARQLLPIPQKTQTQNTGRHKHITSLQKHLLFLHSSLKVRDPPGPHRSLLLRMRVPV